jgi:hypothetical protein
MTARQCLRLLLAAGVLSVVGFAPAPDDKEVPVVKRLTGITPSGLDERGSATKPQAITDTDALARTFPDAAVQARIKEQVDFSRQLLLVFRWAGSGQDRIEPRQEKKGDKVTVVFDYTPGLTRDLRQHLQLFAVRKNVDYRVQTNRPGR